MIYAHSLPGRPRSEWEPLSDHLERVAERAACFASVFGWSEAARVAGRLHDIGKCSAAYQNYIGRPKAAGDRAKGPDHSTAGAREAALAYRDRLGRLLSYVIAGHHAGLCDFEDLRRRIEDKKLDSYSDWPAHAGALPDLAGLPTDAGFRAAFLTRMVFSCLVDADWLATEQFVAEANGEPVERGGFSVLPILRDRLRDHMAAFSAVDPSEVNTLRAEVLAHVIGRAEREPGLFTLTVPTGGGKTLASLSFALEHAVSKGLRRVVYVIPFTSIVEQTAGVFRDALGTRADVLEHHASFDWERAKSLAEADSEGPDGVEKLRRAAENWDAPIVVTTAVQFYESLFASRRSRCRKLHNLAGSVIILDEAQTLPVHLLRPSLAALEELAANYGATVVICTATQPAWRKIDGAIVDKQSKWGGLDIGAERELAPDPGRLYDRLKRVTVERLEQPIEDDRIVARFAECPRMLCIVNTRAHARDLFESIAHLPGAIHLTTLMCPRHRQEWLARARADLRAGQPVRLVATSLIEAGVDIDFPEVWRAAAGLDSIIQAAGRCNREGRLASGRVVVFEPAHVKPPPDLKQFWQAARMALRRHPDPLSQEAIRQYFQELYFVRGAVGLDAALIMREIGDRARDHAFSFASIAKAYRLIENATLPVVVPYDDEATEILGRVAAMERARTDDLRRLNQYVVGLPRDVRARWLATGVLRPVNPALGDALLRFDDLSHYRRATGVDLRDSLYRDAERNVVT